VEELSINSAGLKKQPKATETEKINSPALKLA